MKSEPVIDCTTVKIGPLKGYCTKCGLMQIKGDRRQCPKCGGTDSVPDAPRPAGNIHAIGMTRFTQYSKGNEKP